MSTVTKRTLPQGIEPSFPSSTIPEDHRDTNRLSGTIACIADIAYRASASNSADRPHAWRRYARRAHSPGGIARAYSAWVENHIWGRLFSFRSISQPLLKCSRRHRPMIKQIPAPTHSRMAGKSNQPDHAMNANIPAADRYRNVDSMFPSIVSSLPAPHLCSIQRMINYH